MHNRDWFESDDAPGGIPLVAGGQGREPEEVESEAPVAWFCLLGGAFLLIAAAVLA